MEVSSLIAIASKQYGCVTRTQCLEIMSRGRFEYFVQTGTLIRMHPGVYFLNGSLRSFKTDSIAAALSIPGAVLSGRCAAGLWGLTRAAGRRVELTVPSGGPHVRHGIVVHRSEQLHGWTTKHDFLPITVPARTLVDLTSVLNPRLMKKVLDQAFNLKLVRIAELQHCLEQMSTKGLGKVSILREELKQRTLTDEKLETDLERKVLDWIRNAGLPEPEGQFWVDAQGNHYRCDLAYLRQKIDIEPDGPHHLLPTVAAYDRARDSDVSLEGWHVMRVQEETTEDAFIESLRVALFRRSSIAS